MGGLDGALARFHHDDEGVHGLRGASRQVLQARLHVDDYGLSAMHHDVAQEDAEQRALRAQAAGPALGDGAQGEEFYPPVLDPVGVGDVVHAGV